MAIKKLTLTYFCALIFAAAFVVVASNTVLAAEKGKKTIRGLMSAGGTASGFTGIYPDKGKSLVVPNMSQAAQDIQEGCERDEECEVIYSVGKKNQVHVHSAKPISR